jgi:hypothetical protein
MSEERFNRIDQRFDQVDGRFDRIDQRLDGVDERLDRIETWQTPADDRFDRIDQRIGVLHEDVLSRIAATAEARLPTKREMDERFDELRELEKKRR